MSMATLVDLGVRVELRVRHPAVHELVGERREPEDAAPAAVERARVAVDLQTEARGMQRA